MRWSKSWLAGVVVAALSVACADSEAGAPAASGAESAPGAEQLDLTSEAGRRAAFERLKGDYEQLRARLDGAAQDARGLAADARRDGLRELQRLCDDLERRLDQLEDSGGEQWDKTRAQVLEHAERLRLECERVLGEER